MVELNGNRLISITSPMSGLISETFEVTLSFKHLSDIRRFKRITSRACGADICIAFPDEDRYEFKGRISKIKRCGDRRSKKMDVELKILSVPTFTTYQEACGVMI